MGTESLGAEEISIPLSLLARSLHVLYRLLVVFLEILGLGHALHPPFLANLYD